MSDIAIRVENLGKLYRIGGRQEGYKTFRESLMDAVQAPVRRLGALLGGRNGQAQEDDTIWALQDVSFEVKPGEVVGVIGRNGAGKSTLLKILSRITEPTTGRVEIHGRVGSLLEVGTGFHPELTGRENIFLNGAILGMKKAEIVRRFDEIVAFAEVEKFIDTPVKRYSSGMYLRLAFAVAAHLDPEILLVDEVLAVGDASFQKKCLGKMGDVAKEGRTVLFVSHNMTALRSLCQRAVCLDEGIIVDDGPADKVVSRYLQTVANSMLQQTWDDPQTAPGNDQVRLHLVRISPELETWTDPVTVQTPIKLEFEYWNFVEDAPLNLSLLVYSVEGICVFASWSDSKATPIGLVRGVCSIPGNLLNDGSYNVRILIVKDTSKILLDQSNVGSFEVHDVEREGNWYGKCIGVVRPKLNWTVECLSPLSSDASSLISRADSGF